MPKTRQEKQDIVNELIDKLKNSKAAVIADFTGLTVVDSEQLRQKCKDENIEFLAIKKTLLTKALNEAGVENVDGLDTSGSLAVAFGTEDEVAPAKIVNEFIKDHEQVQFRNGIFENKVIDVNQVKALAALPSKPELYAKIVGSLNAPVSGFVNVLAGNLRGLVNVLNAVKNTKEA